MRVVLDTGVVISSLLFAQGRLTWLRRAWVTSALTPVVSRATADELIRALAYPKFGLGDGEIEAVLAAYLPFCETYSGRARRARGLPRCSDPADQQFLDLASAAEAAALITGDRAHLALDDSVPFSIVTPARLKRTLAA